MIRPDLPPDRETLYPEQVEPVLGGTLALLTQVSDCGCPLMAARITSNLNLLAACPHLSPPFRLLCMNLARIWNARRATPAGDANAAAATATTHHASAPYRRDPALH